MILAVAMEIACQPTKTEAPVSAGDAKDLSWSGSMRSLKGHLEHLAPLIFDSKKFQAPENRACLGREIEEMAVTSQDLNHNPTLTHRDPTVRFVAAQFSQSLLRAHSAMQAGQVGYARYELMTVTSSCVQCHSRMQQGPEFASFFFQDPFLNGLSVLDRAQYLIAIRHFDRAFHVLLEGLKSKDPEIAEHGNYEKLAFLALQLAAQFEQNPKKALQVIASIEKSPWANGALKEKAAVWKKIAEAWDHQPNSVMTMAEARKILLQPTNELQVMRAIPVGLMRLSENISGAELGESLFMMGQAYEFLSEVQPFELHEPYYESCIRSVPHSSVAQKCFASLKASVEAGYTGTSGTHVPIEIQVWLDRLEIEAR
jgi:hypothetical protein